MVLAWLGVLFELLAGDASWAALGANWHGRPVAVATAFRTPLLGAQVHEAFLQAVFQALREASVASHSCLMPISEDSHSDIL